jgi:predicted CxxxxCH...CXXCH cytochrome family protein
VKPLQCSSCHGSELSFAPPVGLGGETLTTERAVGAHQAHLVAGTLSQPVACQECHAVPTSLAHADGTLQLPFGALARNDGATPAYDPITGTCSSTYCHGSTLRSAATGAAGLNLAPLWTGGPGQAACGACHLLPPPQPHPRTQLCDGCHPGYSLTGVNLATHIDGAIQAENLTCSVCHGDEMRVLVAGADGLALAAPPYGSKGETLPSSRAVGAHQAHVNRGDGMALPAKCVTCHEVPTTFDHADGATALHFGALATMNGANPTFDGTTCSNTYCHGSTMNRGGTSHSPTWAGGGPLACTTCHGAPPPAPHPQDPDCIRCHPGYTATSARHATHVNGISDFPSSCNACHDTPPNSGEHYEHIQEGITCSRCHSGYTRTTANEALHRNARQDVTVGGWDPVRRTCSSANGCHESEYWGRSTAQQQTGCNRCHGVPPRSGEHEEHREYRCDRCHGTGYSSTAVNAAKHMNGVVDMPVTFYNRATLSCSNVGCHGSEHWGSRGTVTANCNACHGFPPVAPHPQRTGCHDCHTSMNADGTLTVDHNNGTVNLSGTGCATCHGYPPLTTRTGALHTTDQNCYGCHSTTVDASNHVAPNGTHNDGAVQVGGGGVGTYGCQSCHGDQARAVPAGMDPHLKSAPPYGTRGETLTSQRAVGAHQAHLTTGGLARPLLCAECHPTPTAMDHANGSTVMGFGPLARTDGAAPSWSGTTCSSTYCHGATLAAGGTNHAPLWTGGASQTACGTCHGSPPPAPHTTFQSADPSAADDTADSKAPNSPAPHRCISRMMPSGTCSRRPTMSV